MYTITLLILSHYLHLVNATCNLLSNNVSYNDLLIPSRGVFFTYNLEVSMGIFSFWYPSLMFQNCFHEDWVHPVLWDVTTRWDKMWTLTRPWLTLAMTIFGIRDNRLSQRTQFASKYADLALFIHVTVTSFYAARLSSSSLASPLVAK